MTSGNCNKDAKPAMTLPEHYGDLSVVPMPSMQVTINGAMTGALRDKAVVLTGIFPKVGWGCGLNLGKDKVKSIVESFKNLNFQAAQTC